MLYIRYFILQKNSPDNEDSWPSVANPDWKKDECSSLLAFLKPHYHV